MHIIKRLGPENDPIICEIKPGDSIGIANGAKLEFDEDGLCYIIHEEDGIEFPITTTEMWHIGFTCDKDTQAQKDFDKCYPHLDRCKPYSIRPQYGKKPKKFVMTVGKLIKQLKSYPTGAKVTVGIGSAGPVALTCVDVYMEKENTIYEKKINKSVQKVCLFQNENYP